MIEHLKTITKDLKVNLGDRSYPIHIGRGISGELTKFISDAIEHGRKGVALIDENFLKEQPDYVENIVRSIPHLVIPSGERSKSVDQLSKAWNFMAASKIDRSGFLIAIGGGVVGDLGGFVAASYLRGISFYQVPTTLLAMVDSSVGGKTGINLEAGKNLVGAFHQPSCVWADLDSLNSLPKRQFSAGMAEVIKYGMLGDKNLYDQLVNHREVLNPCSKGLSDLIHRCCSIKARIVQSDEREMSGLKEGRALLNLGHTFGHAIEKVAGYGTYLHGEAVAIGLVCALRLSQKLGKCQNSSDGELICLLESFDLPVRLTSPISVDDLISAMNSDKKVDRGILRFVVMEEIGHAVCTEEVSLDLVKDVWTSVGAC